MNPEDKTTKENLLEIADLRIRFDEAEETLSAIRRGEVDALVVSGPDGDQVFTLKGAERSYRFFVEAMNEGAVTLSLDGTILYCNDRFAELVETPYQRIIGDSIYRFITSPDAFEPAFQRGKEEKSKAEILLKRKHNESVPVSVSFNPMRENEVPGICMVATDLTEHVRKDEMLRKRAQQLARMSSQLTLAEQRERRRLASIIHDHLQQLLIGAKIRLEVLAEEIGKDQQQNLEQIHNLVMESVQTSRSLIAQMAPHVLYECGLGPGLEWLARTFKETYNINIDTDIDPSIPVDPEDLKVLLFESVRELLFNVVKHALVSAARVDMTRNSAGDLRITVSDRGVGFVREKLTEDLGRDDHFGLFSIRERLELVRGRLEIYSCPGEGTVVDLIVPMDQTIIFEGPPAGCGVPPEETTADLASSPQRRIRVLLVDDHIVMRQGLYSLLERHSDIQVVGEAMDGEEAVQMTRKLEPEVILMDVKMPKLDGIGATRLIHSEWPDIRIIGLSMYEGAETEKGMINAGAAAFISKSGPSDVLLNAIREQDRNREYGSGIRP